MILSYICPKRQCRHAWTEYGETTMRNRDCPACGASDVLPVACEDDPFDDTDDGSDDGDDLMDECGFIPGEGLCMLAGSEWCDWECPFNPCDPEGI